LTRRTQAAAWALATCGAVVVIDQASKSAIRETLARGERDEVLPFLTLTNTRNRGVAFGLAGDVSPVLVGAALAVLLALLTFLAFRAKSDWPIWLPAGLLIGGALGNLADRVRDEGVTDFIDLPLWATFNLADVAITAGVILLLVLPERDRSPPSP
jgi:signal peptidase II